MKKITKTLVGAAAATAMAVSATSVSANDRHHDKGIGAGEVIAGAVIIGGIAAVLASSSKKNDRNYSRGNRGYGSNDSYGHRDNYRRTSSREAVQRCIRRAEKNASRYGRARVTDIRDIDRDRYGYKVKGRIVVETGSRYNRGYKNGYGRDYDKGKFTCYVERGYVSDIKFSGLKYR